MSKKFSTLADLVKYCKDNQSIVAPKPDVYRAVLKPVKPVKPRKAK